MMDVIKMFWTFSYSFLSGMNNFAKSFEEVSEVVVVNATAFKEQELIETQAKTQALREQLKEVA